MVFGFAQFGSRRFGIALLIVAAANLLAAGQVCAMDLRERESILREAIAAYDQGLGQRDENAADHAEFFRRAALGFEAVLADGVSNGYLHYNLANAYLQLDELGKAILHYRRGARLIGADEQLQANLKFARSLRRNQIRSSGEKKLWETVFFWHYETSTRVRLVVGLIAYVGFWLLLTLRVARRRTGMVSLTCVLAVLWVSAGTSVVTEVWHERCVREGVTVQNDITVRKGNGEASAAAFRELLHEGTEFIILEERPGWFRIQLPDGNSGWIRQSQAIVI